MLPIFLRSITANWTKIEEIKFSMYKGWIIDNWYILRMYICFTCVWNSWLSAFCKSIFVFSLLQWVWSIAKTISESSWPCTMYYVLIVVAHFNACLARLFFCLFVDWYEVVKTKVCNKINFDTWKFNFKIL